VVDLKCLDIEVLVLRLHLREIGFNLRTMAAPIAVEIICSDGRSGTI
jgi:hypothetical protein